MMMIMIGVQEDQYLNINIEIINIIKSSILNIINIGDFFMYKLRKIMIMLLSFCILFKNSYIVYADDLIDTENIEIMQEIEAINTSANLDKEPQLNSRAAIIYDRNSKEIIFGKNENSRRPMASTTKILTATVVLEKVNNLSEIVTVSKKAAGIGGSRLGLKANDKITVNDLLYGLLLVSGNDTAVALAEYVGGDLPHFAELMNTKAKELGLKDSSFVTPHGLDSEEHYTTAYELAKIADYALENKTFSKIVNTKYYTVSINGNPKNLSNTNELLGNLNGVNGVKTGFTNGANRCLVTSVNRNGMNIITVVLGADTKKFRTSDSIKLIEYAYSNYKNIKITDLVNNKYLEWKNSYEKNIFINKGVMKNINTKIADLENDCITIEKSKENNIYVQIDSINYLEAPVEEDMVIGKLRIFVGDEKKVELDILNGIKIEKMNLLNYYKELFFNNFNNMENVS